MFSLTLAGGLFLAWRILVFLFTPGINYHLSQRSVLDASREVTLDLWRRRPLWEKIAGPFVWILERQQ
jgi:hypothetical protein